MRLLIVGGTFSNNPDEIKRSGVVRKMLEHIDNINAYTHCIEALMANSGTIETLEVLVDAPINEDADVTIWMPNITNEEPKHYPRKKQGSVLICSKVMREGYTRADSISRIFKMHGNAVIEIRKDEKTGMVSFTLVDALGNIWYDGNDIPSLMTSIMSFVAFTKAARRINTSRTAEDYIPVAKYFEDNKANLEILLDTNRKLQHHIQTSCGNRFFGNVSTRCQKLFPSIRANLSHERGVAATRNMFVSPRNSNKESLTPEDMVLYLTNSDSYCGENKPSVDSPAQARLYDKMNNINFMIHGHAEIHHPHASRTKHYKLCGDVNEVDEILKVVNKDANSFIVNLLGHGFLIGARTGEELSTMVDKLIQEAEFKITNQS
jgi:hypothetical protein